MKSKLNTKQSRRPKLTHTYSILGRTKEATTAKDGELTFNLNKLKQQHDTKLGINPLILPDTDAYFNSFIAYMCAVELHEIGHVYNFPVGCNHGKQKQSKECPWCEEVQKIYWWLV